MLADSDAFKIIKSYRTMLVIGHHFIFVGDSFYCRRFASSLGITALNRCHVITPTLPPSLIPRGLEEPIVFWTEGSQFLSQRARNYIKEMRPLRNVYDVDYYDKMPRNWFIIPSYGKKLGETLRDWQTVG